MSLTNTRSDYANAMYQFCSNGLLHLYITISERKIKLPLVHKNKILSKFIEQNKKNKKYSLLKKDFKLLKSVKSKLSLETCLHDLLEKVDKINEKKNVLQEYLIMLCEVAFEFDLEISFKKEDVVLDSETMLVTDKELLHCINSNGVQERPITVYINTVKDVALVAKFIEKNKQYRVMSLVSNATDHQIRLTRKS